MTFYEDWTYMPISNWYLRLRAPNWRACEEAKQSTRFTDNPEKKIKSDNVGEKKE